MTKVRLLTNARLLTGEVRAGVGGDVVDLDADEAKALVDSGSAEAVKEPKVDAGAKIETVTDAKR